MELIPVCGTGAAGGSTGGAGRIRGGRGGRRRSVGRERFDGLSLSFDLFEDMRQGLHGEDVLGQLSQQRQVAGLQTAAAQDAESAPGGGGR